MTMATTTTAASSATTMKSTVRNVIKGDDRWYIIYVSYMYAHSNNFSSTFFFSLFLYLIDWINSYAVWEFITRVCISFMINFSFLLLSIFSSIFFLFALNLDSKINPERKTGQFSTEQNNLWSSIYIECDNLDPDWHLYESQWKKIR